MQIKYLTLAMTAALALNLTACGSDKDDDHNHVDDSKTETPVDSKYDANGYDKDGFNKDGFNKDGFNAEGFNKDGFNAEGFNKDGYNAEGFDKDGYNAEGLDANGDPKPVDDDTPVSENGDAASGAGGDSTGQVGATDAGQIVAGVQYIRSATSDFDKIRNPDNAKDADAALLADLTAQNRKFTNIVVGIEVYTDADGTKKYIKRLAGDQNAIGGAPNPNDSNADQKHNEIAEVDVTAATSQVSSDDGSGKDNGIIVVKNVTSGTNTNLEALNVDLFNIKQVDSNSVSIQETFASNSRFFGRHYLPSDDVAADETNRPANSHMFAVRNASGAAIELKGTEVTGSAGEYTLDSQRIRLENVQYGRVTTDIEPLSDADVANLSFNNNVSYTISEHVTGLDRANMVKEATDSYFFRGLNETKTLPASGKFEYAGHALMYGIDNTANVKADELNSTSVTNNSNPYAIGNFVQASVDFADKSVKGEVYNVLLNDTAEEEAVQDTLVTFAGTIGAANSVSGTADRTYVAGDDKATFHGAFYGSKAEEFGGSFNAVTDEVKLGQATWGGVFGAKQIGVTTPVVDDGNGAISQ